MNTTHYKNRFHKLIGWKTLSGENIANDDLVEQRGSNIRRAFSRWCIALCIVMFFEALLFPMRKAIGIVTFIIAAHALMFFVWNVIMTPFRTSERFTVNAPRLLQDTIISSVLMVFVFALLYRIFGTDPIGTPMDNLYFSAVTFSTLGFGDIKPAPNAQVFAAFEALIGNLHLGIMVAATFAAITNNVKR
ncbi:MAG: potassium channel family protein [Maricaulaceae bacterium]